MQKITKAKLRNIFEEEQSLLKETRLAFPWEDRTAYAGWLVNTYEYVRKSTRILALTAGRMPLDKTTYSSRFIAHAAEEKGHERLVENDLRHLGYDFRKCEPTVMAQAFHHSYYYWIYESNPIGMYGLILALEGFAVRNVPEMHKICAAAHGPKCASFLKVHAEEDEGHLKSCFESIESFTDEENALVASTTRFYARMYGAAMLLSTQAAAEKKNGELKLAA